jgi:hypothetical protein
MAPYASVAQLREYLVQVPAGAAYDALLDSVLDRAMDIIDGRLGFTFSAYGEAATAADVRCPADSEYFMLPHYGAGTITSVYELYGKGLDSEDTEEITEYEALDDGRLYYAYDWERGQWYRITAKWGYGAAPDSIVQVCLELAINLWSARESRTITDVVGVEGGGAVGYSRSLTNRQRMILDGIRQRYMGVTFA